MNLLYLELSGLFRELEALMNEHLEFEDQDLVLDFYFQVRDFLYVHDRLTITTGSIPGCWRTAAFG